jgi:putative ABC transport system permease protein
MSRIANALAVFLVATRRLWYQRGLALLMLLGLTTAVAVTTSVPFYADAISRRILAEKLYENQDESGPPFSFLFRYVGSWSGYLEWEACQPVDQYITGYAASALGLPPKQLVRYFKTDPIRLFPASEVVYADARDPLAYVSLGFLGDVASHINILDGQFPRVLTNDSEPIEVLVAAELVGQLGLGVGEEYILQIQDPSSSSTTGQYALARKVRIAGVWEPIDPNEDYWFYPQFAFQDLLLVPEASFAWFSKEVKGEVGLAVWSLLCQGDQVGAADVGPLLQRIAVVRNKSHAFLQDIDLARSPERALAEYQRTIRSLMVVLYAFSVPILGLNFYFVSLVAGMIVQRQRNELAVLRSRGMAAAQVVTMYVLQGLIVGVIAFAGGTLLGERMARMMTATRSFLRLEGGFGAIRSVWSSVPSLETFSWINLRFGVFALLIAVPICVAPAIRAARDTVITYKQEQARSLRAPFWQRSYLDLFLLIPSLYGYYLLRRRGTISFLDTKGVAASPFSNPFLFLVPMLLVCSLALLCIRLLPRFLRLLAWLAGGWRGAVPVLAFRQLSRTSGLYVAPVFLLILTLSVAVFTASMARTLDEHIVDAVYYQVGADYSLIEMGESAQPIAATPTVSASEEVAGPEWFFLPVSEHRQIPGVESVTRIWNREVSVRLADEDQDARLIGIDRIDFPTVAFFRRDFAPASLGALMNALAVRSDAVLVCREAFEQGGLEVGDKIEISIPVGSAPKTKVTVAGVVDYFPSIYAEDGLFLIANLDFIFDTVGGVYPYDVWLKTMPALTESDLVQETEGLGIRVLDARDARQWIDREQLQPERQGVFGLVSIGFVASALLTVLGFVIYSFVSFSRRYIELGVLRAVGLSAGQMALFLVMEHLMLVAVGAAAGTGLGVWVSTLFIPFYHVPIGKYALTPPLLVHIAWQEVSYIYGVFGVMFVGAVVALLLLLRRLKIFEAIKLGETV